MTPRAKLILAVRFVGLFIALYLFFGLIDVDGKGMLAFLLSAVFTFLYWYRDYQERIESTAAAARSSERHREFKLKEEAANQKHFGGYQDAPGWGYLVYKFKPGLWRDNIATAKDIIGALGSNHPLLKPADDKSPTHWQEYYNEMMQKYHFDGHLAIGGSLFWDGRGHMLTVGTARIGGKGSCLVLPALLAIPNILPNAPSYVVLDPKGENLAVSGEYLLRCGYDVICINPFSIPEVAEFGKSGFNVFDTFNAADADFDKFADMVANSIVVPSKNSNSHFDKTSRSYIALYIRHMMTQDEEPKNFRTLYKWLRQAGEDRENFLQHTMGSNMAFDGDIANEALAIFSQIISGANKEVESTYSTIRAATDQFKSPMLRDAISTSDFDITKIAQKKTAIFVCMNPSDLEDNQAFMRILFGSFIRSLTRNYNKKRKVVMVMDEFPTMGYFKEFEIMSGFMAGYNVTLWPIMQDLTQLKGLYPNSWEVFVGNAVIRHFSAIGDNFTADYVSKRMPVVNKGSEEKPNREPLMRPDEVQAAKEIITFISGVEKPAMFYKDPYWKMEDIAGNASSNPFI